MRKLFPRMGPFHQRPIHSIAGKPPNINIIISLSILRLKSSLLDDDLIPQALLCRHKKGSGVLGGLGDSVASIVAACHKVSFILFGISTKYLDTLRK